jgi:hypothetical protein
MSHIHWVTRQNKLDIPIDKDKVYLYVFLFIMNQYVDMSIGVMKD